MSFYKLLLKQLLGRDLWIRSEVEMDIAVLGTDYGGWGVDLSRIDENSIVYSFGIGEDASFDLALIEAKFCKVHGFDPTPKSIQWVAEHITSPLFEHYPWAIGSCSGELEFWLPENKDHVSATSVPDSTEGRQSVIVQCFPLGAIMSGLGHSKLDLLKMDVEGAEYEVIEQMSEEGTLRNVRQLLVEFHHWMKPFSPSDTKKVLALLKREGFKIAWVSPSGHEVMFTQ